MAERLLPPIVRYPVVALMIVGLSCVMIGVAYEFSDGEVLNTKTTLDGQTDHSAIDQDNAQKDAFAAASKQHRILFPNAYPDAPALDISANDSADEKPFPIALAGYESTKGHMILVLKNRSTYNLDDVVVTYSVYSPSRGLGETRISDEKTLDFGEFRVGMRKEETIYVNSEDFVNLVSVSVIGRRFPAKIAWDENLIPKMFRSTAP